MRGAVGWALIVCLMVAMAPWMSGGQDTLAMFLGSGALLLGVLLTWRQPAVRGLKAGMLVWSAAGLLGWAALSLAWTANRYSTVVWLVMLVTAILAFRLSYVVAGWQWGRERLLAAYVAVTLAVCAYGYWFYLTVSYERFVSSFYWPNPAAAFLIPGVLVGMFGLRKGGRVAWWWTAYLVVVGTAFALASSRGAALALGVAVLGYVVLRKWSKQAWVRFVCIIAAVVVLSYGLAVWHERIFNGVNTTTLTSRVAEAASGTTQSGSDRIYYLRSAVTLWARAPLWGSGAG
ncbi:MAG TPA: O-antigen ligase family protein, partial [Candidatus Saccharimonas sp.]|nr:O-antigen ligase family protein [Candidatus Saccharimonas sp.]